MASVSMEHLNSQAQNDLLNELINGPASQHEFTELEICDAMDSSQIHTVQHIVQIILENRRRIRRETLSQSVKKSLKNRKSQLTQK